MNIAFKLLQAIEEDKELTDDGAFKDFLFPGACPFIGPSPGQKPFGYELKHPKTGKAIEKEVTTIVKSLKLPIEGKTTVKDVYQDFKELYGTMLKEVHEEIKKDEDSWIMTLPNMSEVKLEHSFISWMDHKNGVMFHCTEEKGLENLIIYFHFKAWPCFNPLEGEKNRMKGKPSLNDKIREKNKSKLVKVGDTVEEEREKLAASITEENEKNGAAPEE